MTRQRWWGEAAALAAFAAVTAALAVGGPLVSLDLAVERWVESHRPPAAETVARVLNLLGQGGVLLALTVLAGAWLAWRLRTLRPLGYVFVAVLLVVPPVLLVKALTERGAPSSTLPPEQTVRLLGPLPPGEYAAGYPSGHVVNTVVWYGVLLLLVTALLRAYGRGDPPVAVRRVVRAGPPVVVLATTTYLSFHWLTDGLAGLAYGVFVDLVLRRVRWMA